MYLYIRVCTYERLYVYRWASFNITLVFHGFECAYLLNCRTFTSRIINTVTHVETIRNFCRGITKHALLHWYISTYTSEKLLTTDKSLSIDNLNPYCQLMTKLAPLCKKRWHVSLPILGLVEVRENTPLKN